MVICFVSNPKSTQFPLFFSIKLSFYSIQQLFYFILNLFTILITVLISLSFPSIQSKREGWVPSLWWMKEKRVAQRKEKRKINFCFSFEWSKPRIDEINSISMFSLLNNKLIMFSLVFELISSILGLASQPYFSFQLHFIDFHSHSNQIKFSLHSIIFILIYLRFIKRWDSFINSLSLLDCLFFIDPSFDLLTYCYLWLDLAYLFLLQYGQINQSTINETNQLSEMKKSYFSLISWSWLSGIELIEVVGLSFLLSWPFNEEFHSSINGQWVISFQSS